jgi:hypothetical protein
MNIFATDSDTLICATYHTDLHTIKMPLELSQMVSFVYNHKELWDAPIPHLLMGYSPTYDKHPCSLWVKENISNFYWTCELGIKLVEEYRFRYNSEKHQRCMLIFQWALDNLPELEIECMTQFAKAMPDEYKVDCSIESYRNYYKFGKTELHQWTKREKPEWIQ